MTSTITKPTIDSGTNWSTITEEFANHLEWKINRKDHWKNFVFRIKNNLTSHKRIDNDPKYRDFKDQLALYKKKSSIINYPEDILFMEKTNKFS